MQTTFSHNVKPSFIYKKMTRKKLYNSFLYQDNSSRKDYKINFFIPVEDEFIMDINRYIDVEKIREKIESPIVFHFVQQMSINSLGFSRIDFDFLLDNIGRSLIFKVLRSSDEALKVYKGEKVEYEVFMFAMLQWKNGNPSFGFPDELELIEYLKRRDLPPMPRKMHGLLTKLGHSTINQQDFENILYKITTLDPDERESFLLTSFPQLSTEYKIESLVIAVRSDRIFSVCKVLGNRGNELLVPMINCISLVLDSNELDAEILGNYRSRFGALNQDYKPNSFYWEAIATKMLMNAANNDSWLSFKDPMQSKFLEVMNSLVSEGLLEKLNYYTSSHAILRTVEFKVEPTLFLNWIIDLLDAAYKSRFTKRPLNFLDKSRKIYGEGGILSSYFPSLRYQAIRLSQFSSPDSLTVFKGKKKIEKTFLKAEKSIPGVTDIEFRPLTEEAHDEFDFAHAYDEDIQEYYEFDDDIPIKDMIYTIVGHLDLVALTDVRGGAYTVIVGCNSLDLNVLKAFGHKYFYTRNLASNTIYGYLDTICQHLMVISKESTHLEFESYRKLNHDEVLKKFKVSKYQNNDIFIDGKKYSKVEVYSKPFLRNKLENVDQYFKKISNITLEKEMESADKKMKLVRECVTVNEDFQKYSKELEEKIKYYKSMRQTEKKDFVIPIKGNDVLEEKEEKDGNIEEKPKDLVSWLNKSNLSGMLSKMDSRLMELADSGQARSSRIVNEPVPYSFKEPMKLLSDLRFKSEFETLFPGYWSRFVNNEILMTKKTKKYRIQFAELRINQMPAYMRKKYSKLLLIVKFMLCNIEECDYVGYEDSVFSARLDELFDVEYEAALDPIDVINDLEIDYSEGTLKLNLDFLT
jgi:hypothetical protein